MPLKTCVIKKKKKHGQFLKCYQNIAEDEMFCRNLWNVLPLISYLLTNLQPSKAIIKPQTFKKLMFLKTIADTQHHNPSL